MTIAYSVNIPNPPNDPADDVSTMQSNAAAIGTIIAVDHVGFNVAGGGQHAQVTFNANNVPTPPVSPPVLFTDAPANHGGSGGNTVPELFFYSGNAPQSSNQFVLTGNGSVLLLGGIIIKWGQVGAAVNGNTYTFASAFPNNVFSVVVTFNGASVPPNIVGTNGYTTTGFTFRSNAGGGVPVSYIAIGN
jgi:hypothetical protein